MTKDQTLEKFTSLLASDAPTPGGGSAAACAAALGAALTHMVAALTVGRKKYSTYEKETQKLLSATEALRQTFLQAIDDDIVAFSEMAAVFGMPKATQEEQLDRSAAMQAALISCSVPPMKIMEHSVETLHLTLGAVGKTNRTAVSDLGVAAHCLKAAATGAWLNILINIHSSTDENFRQQTGEKGKRLLEQADLLCEAIFSEVEKEIFA